MAVEAMLALGRGGVILVVGGLALGIGLALYGIYYMIFRLGK